VLYDSQLRKITSKDPLSLKILVNLKLIITIMTNKATRRKEANEKETKHIQEKFRIRLTELGNNIKKNNYNEKKPKVFSKIEKKEK
jgi:hypothetical protein